MTQLKNGPKYLHKATSSWDEATITFNNFPKYASDAIASNTNTSLQTWEDFDITAAIKGIVENGEDNYGFILHHTTYDLGVKIRSSEYSTVDERPKLTITYDNPVQILPVPEPLTGIIAGPCKVTITNLQGREITSFGVDDASQLRQMNKSLSTGVHIVTVQTVRNMVFHRKWVLKYTENKLPNTNF